MYKVGLSNLPIFVHYGILVYKGNVITIKGQIMHKPKMSALSAQDCYYFAKYTNPVMHKNWYSPDFSVHYVV